jgi:hypothetical protein
MPLSLFPSPLLTYTLTASWLTLCDQGFDEKCTCAIRVAISKQWPWGCLASASASKGLGSLAIMLPRSKSSRASYSLSLQSSPPEFKLPTRSPVAASVELIISPKRNTNTKKTTNKEYSNAREAHWSNKLAATLQGTSYL